MSALEPSIAPYTVAAIQFDPVLGEKDTNISHLLRLTEEAAQHGARLIVHPELATTGYCWLSREEVAPYVRACAWSDDRSLRATGRAIRLLHRYQLARG